MCLRQCFAAGRVLSPHFTPPSVKIHFDTLGIFCVGPSVTYKKYITFINFFYVVKTNGTKIHEIIVCSYITCALRSNDFLYSIASTPLRL